MIKKQVKRIFTFNLGKKLQKKWIDNFLTNIFVKMLTKFKLQVKIDLVKKITKLKVYNTVFRRNGYGREAN